MASLPVRLIVYLAAVAACAAVPWLAANLYVRAVYDDPLGRWLASLLVAPIAMPVSAALSILAYRGLVVRFERRPPGELGRAAAVPELLRGAGLGLGLIAAVYAILALSGHASYAGVHANRLPDLAVAAVLAAASSICEEILFRGIVFRLVEQRFGAAVALAVSTVLFGLAHAWNPEASALSSAAIALEGGLLLGAAYMTTRRLWLPIGLHFGWNFGEGGLFGGAVSGEHANGVLTIHLEGSALLTGGKFGPEASIVAVAVTLALAGLLGWRAMAPGKMAK